MTRLGVMHVEPVTLTLPPMPADTLVFVAALVALVVLMTIARASGRTARPATRSRVRHARKFMAHPMEDDS